MTRCTVYGAGELMERFTDAVTAGIERESQLGRICPALGAAH